METGPHNQNNYLQEFSNLLAATLTFCPFLFLSQVFYFTKKG
jgi:hypothetical protein